MKKGNLASIMEIDENMNEHFNIYKEAPENERKKEILEENIGDEDSDKFFV